MNLNVFITSFLSLFLSISYVSWAQLTDDDVTQLNQVMNKTYSKTEWENLNRLHLDALPEAQFPAGFDKLQKLSILDLLPAKDFADCQESRLKSSAYMTRSAINPHLHELFKGEQLCLSGRNFTIEERIGSGDKAVVYRIKDLASNNIYAFTRWNNDFGTEPDGSFLVLSRARKAKNRINMPLLVNKKEYYSITPLMTGRLASEGPSYNQWRPQGDCDLLLREDGIFGARDTHTNNYMYPNSQSSLLKAIDFRTFRKFELFKDKPEELSPKYISVPMGDPKKCVVE